jgi:1,4-dihydroxy-2-naphthoyl-CoA synthase
MDRDQWMLTGETSDYAEGAAAFVQKRKPTFRGD